MTQGLLAVMVADTAPADLRGTTCGFFNLVSGVALLIASLVAGLPWDSLGAPARFLTGAVSAEAAVGGKVSSIETPLRENVHITKL